MVTNTFGIEFIRVMSIRLFLNQPISLKRAVLKNIYVVNENLFAVFKDIRQFLFPAWFIRIALLVPFFSRQTNFTKSPNNTDTPINTGLHVSASKI